MNYYYHYYHDYFYFYNYYNYYYHYHYYHNCVTQDLVEDEEVHGGREGTLCRTQPGRDFSTFLHKVDLLG